MVDVSSFASRAQRWSNAQTRHRDDAIERAEALAAMQRRMEAEESEAAEDAEATEPEAPAAPDPAPTPPAPAAPATTAPAADPPPADPPADDSSDGDAAGADDAAATFGLPPPAAGPSPEQWLAMRFCESRHQYDVTSPSGAYRGAWQFSQTTWNWVAEKRGHDHLVGVDPIDASRAEQDLMAYELYDMPGGGDKHWPRCGRHLR